MLSSPEVIRLPTKEDLLHLGAGFACLTKPAAFNRVVGSVDYQIHVKPPREDAACYLNR